MKRKFVLRTEGIVKTLEDYLWSVFDPANLYEVIIRPYKSQRSAAQNNTYWMWVTDISRQKKSKYGDYRNEDFWHFQLAIDFLPIQGTANYNGVDVPIPKSTRDLKVDEFSEYLQEIEAWSMREGISLRFPDDYHLAIGSSDGAMDSPFVVNQVVRCPLSTAEVCE